MEEVLSALELLKEELICRFCNELVDQPSVFTKCGHIFCNKHIEKQNLTSCFTCHRGDLKYVQSADDVREIVNSYGQLDEIFKSLQSKREENLECDEINNISNDQTDNNKQKKSHPNGKETKTKAILSPIKLRQNVEKIEPQKRVLRKKTITNNSETENKDELKTDTPETKQNNDEPSKAIRQKRKVKELPDIAPASTTKPGNILSNKNQNEKESVTTGAKKVAAEIPKTIKETIAKNFVKSDGKMKLDQNISRDHFDESISDMSISNVNKYLWKRNTKGETQLHAACVRSKMDVVKNLLQSGASPNTKDFAGWTPLHEAVVAGNAEMISLLLSHGALPSVPGPHYDTPLHEAVRSNNMAIARILVQNGADINARNDKNITPLDLASDDIKTILSEPSSANLHNLSLSQALEQTDVYNIYPSSLTKEYVTKLQTLCSKHENLKLVHTFSKNVHYVIISDAPWSSGRVQTDTLLAVAAGKVLISCEWIDHCNLQNIANFEKYQITNIGGPVECVTLSIRNKKMLLPGLFDGCHFFFMGFTSKYEISVHLTVKKQYLCQLVEEAGGTVLKREPNPEAIPDNEKVLPYHAPSKGPLACCAHFIIYQNRPALAYNMGHLKSLPIGWLIECLQNFHLVDP